jgi:predicted Na+-dependent transporter
VPATQIAQNLAFINWTLLTGLALGSFAAVVLLRRRAMATGGYLRFTVMCALGFGILAWISDGALPDHDGQACCAQRHSVSA